MTPEETSNGGPPSNTGEATGDIKTPNTDNKRYRRRGFRKPVPGAARPAIKQPKFEGKCVELKGHIYDCSDARQSDIFVKTTKEIAEYVGRTFKKGSDTRLAVENLTMPTLDLPVAPTDETDKTLNKIWDKEVDEYVKRKTQLADNMQTVYSLVWGQCTDVMRQKVEALAVYKTLTLTGDGLTLLKAIKGLVYNFQSQKYLSHALHESKRRFYLCTQGRHTTASTYLEQYQNIVDVIEHSGGSIGNDPGILEALATKKKVDTDAISATDLAKLQKEAQEQYLAAAFLLGADRSRYGRLIEGLENDYLQGQDRYSKTITSAFNLLINWKQITSRSIETPNDGVSFLKDADDQDQDDERQPGVSFATDGEQKNNYKGKHYDKAKVTCHRCGNKGHYAPECDQDRQGERQTSSNMLMAGVESGEFDNDDLDHSAFLFFNATSTPNLDVATAPEASIALKMSKGGQVPKTWILLDNQSTVDVFCNDKLLSNIRPGAGYMDIHCNAGVTSTNLVGDLAGYGEVWYNPNGIANILSLSRVQERGFRVTFDSATLNEFHVHKSDGTKRTFKQSKRGLYFLDTQDTGITLINTVEGNKNNFTNRDYSRAVLARKTQKVIGRPSDRTFIKIVEGRQIEDCPITKRDINVADAIIGNDKGTLQGKTVRHGTLRVETTLTDIPATIMSHYREVVLGGDIMFVNRLPFFMTISRNIKFGTAESIKNQQNKTILAAIKQVKSVYMRRGFIITHLLMDGQFESLRADIADHQITLNTVARDEHVPEIERRIRTVKERTRCIYNSLPFRHVPPRMLIEMVYASNFWLNCFPPADGVSKVLSPRAIVVGMQLNFKKHCQLEFGSYVQTHEEHDNSMAPRTTGAIALRPTGNEQGSHYFYSLSTGRRINRNRWTSLPMPNEVMDRIRNLARQANANLGLLFTDRHGHPLADADDPNDSDDESYDPDDDPDAESDADDDYLDDVDPVPIAGVNETEDNEPANDNDNESTNEAEDNENDNVTDGTNNDGEMDPQEDNDGEMDPQDEDDDDAESKTGIDNNQPIETNNNDRFEADMEEKYGQRNSAHALRPRRPRDYSHIHTTLEGTVMTQHSMKKGLKIFGEAGTQAVLKELKQLHDRKVLEPADANKMTPLEKKRALAYLMSLKKKRDQSIKGRGCADGRKQREYTAKEDASAPTVAIESVMLSCVIDAEENRDVATVDIPGAFMQADMDELVHMKLEGKMAELVVKLDPKLYRKHIQLERGKQILYVELKKALYGTLRGALLFWKKLSAQLQEWGFKVNPYDWCVANKSINGKQCTILWHVDDLKISHVESKVVSSVIKQLETAFGDADAPLTVTRGLVHDYLGMTLDYSTPGKVQIMMIDYITNMLDELPPDMDGEAATAAPNHLFEVNEKDPVMLTEEKAVMFHHNVAKMLFLCKRARPDIQTAVAFLCTRVKGPDVDDYKKLTRVVRYLRGTLKLPLTLQADNMHVVKWWVDASFAVHPDMKSHTGGIMSLGKGAIYGTSTRQKLNTKSSTEAELVGVNDVMPQILWTRYFLEAQGYGIQDSIINQDNQSSILLEKHGRASSSKRTRHINIRYFFVTDRVAAKEVSVQYCPTGEMIADFFTKALQGTLFRKFRDFIMNCDPSTNSLQDHRSVLKCDRAPKGPNGGRADEAQANKIKNVIVAREPQKRRSKTVSWTTVKGRG